jgi:hypothetical protein
MAFDQAIDRGVELKEPRARAVLDREVKEYVAMLNVAAWSIAKLIMLQSCCTELPTAFVSH